MYDLDGKNYKIWTTYNDGSFNSNKSVLYGEDNYQLNSGNLFRLDILVWELPTTIHPIYIQKYTRIIREFFQGVIIFVGENIDPDYNYLLDNLNYPIFYIKRIERKWGFKTLSDIKNGLMEDSHTIEDKEGNIQSISSWKTQFIRDRKLGNILGD
jgi:hypothetical protein